MKINIRLIPMEGGVWRWTVGRAGIVSRSGTAETCDLAQADAEAVAEEYASEVRSAQSYLYDTDSRERIGYKAD